MGRVEILLTFSIFRPNFEARLGHPRDEKTRREGDNEYTETYDIVIYSIA